MAVGHRLGAIAMISIGVYAVSGGPLPTSGGGAFHLQTMSR